MEAILTKCFICDVACIAHDKYLGINIARTLTMPIGNILDKCLRAQIDVEKECFCAECAKKIEEYDQVVQLSLQIETELYELYHKKASESCYLIDAEVIGDLTKIEHDDPSKSENEDPAKTEYEDSIETETNYQYDGMVVEYLEDTDQHLNESTSSSEHIEDGRCSDDKEESPPQRRKSKRNPEARVQIEVKIYKCKKCHFKTLEYDEFIEHRAEHETEERFVCDICGRSYKSKSALTTHIGLHSNRSPFECQLCNKTFTQRGALVRHMPIHTGEKPHQCDVCGKRFIHYSSFHMHQMIHTNERRKKCEICGLELRSNSHMSRHMRVHTGEKPFECPICGQKFAQRYNMKTHYNTHQGIHRIQTKNHKCILCEEAFARRERLRKHLIQDHGVSIDDCNTFMEKGPDSDIARKIVNSVRDSNSMCKEEILVEYIDDVDGELMPN